jgi:anhydro-N-acetylmuramic acid kinase
VIVAGVMSGTSADGINVALVDIRARATGETRQHFFAKLTLLGHAEYPYAPQVRRTILQLMNAEKAKVADLARINFILGELYADAVVQTQKKLKRKAELVGCHGQTLYHQGEAQPFLGRRVSVTWQTGEAAVIAARTGIPVVSDFRPADLAAGGKGAPLVPFLDYILYSDEKVGRIVQNIGGIANLTAIAAAADPSQVVAFDTGPGNMVIDALMDRLYRKRFDSNGRIAASGTVLQGVLTHFLRAPFFSRKPPKTAGREEFGREFVSSWIRRCRSARKQDMVATATALTAHSIAHAIARFVLSRSGSFSEVVVSGGGARNRALMQMLQAAVSRLSLRVRTSDEFGVPAEAKEAVAFALLAFQTWHREPSNVPSATGAKRPVILGKVSYA